MKRLEAIERLKFRKGFLQSQCEDCWTEEMEMALSALILVNHLIDCEITFCKDCVWYEPRLLRCNNTRTTEWDPNDFCSSGMRKEESNDNN